MNRDSCFNWARIGMTGAFLATLFLVACNQAQPPANAPAAESKAVAANKEVYVIFEGPWSIVTDPKDANSVLLLAPKTKIHRDLFVAASNDTGLAPGVYDLSVPAHGPATSGPLDASFAQATIDSKSLQRALDDKLDRYVIRLPKPEAYVAARRYRSRLGSTYPPDAASEQNYASSVSLLYRVGSMNGFLLAGAPDAGTFNPVLLQLDTPTIRFAIEPAQVDDPKDQCDTHSREAFRDTTKFLGLNLFVDFPSNPSTCHDNDPQKVRPAKAQAGGDDARPTNSRVASEMGVPRYPFAAMFLFFHGTSIDCRPPILFLTVTG